MSLVRWKPSFPSTRLLRDFDRMLDDFPRFPFAAWPHAEGEWAPPLSIRETDDILIVQADIPGVEAKDLDVNVSDNLLTIKGEKHEQKSEKKDNTFCMERSFGSFMRQITLPTPVATDGIEAMLDKGVLTLRLPRAKKGASVKIKVK